MGVRVEAPGERLRRQADRHRPAARRQHRRQRQLGQLARPGAGRARRQGVRRPRRRREGRHLHRHRADEPGPADGGGLPKNLLSPQVQVNLTTKLDQRRADTRLRLTSPAIGGRRRRHARPRPKPVPGFQGRRPAVAARRRSAPNIDGTDVRLAMVLNGAFGTPFVAYDLRARTLSFNETTIELLQARGRAKVDADRISIPVQARARRISGLDPSLGGLLTNVGVNGTINISGTRLVSDNLKVRSDRLNATVVARRRSRQGPVSRRDPGHGEQLPDRGDRPARPHHQHGRGHRRQRLRPQGPGRGPHPADRQSDRRRGPRRQCHRLRQRRDDSGRSDHARQRPAELARASGSPRAAGRSGPTAGSTSAPPACRAPTARWRWWSPAPRRGRRSSSAPPVPASASAFATSPPRSAPSPAAMRSARRASRPTGRSRPTSRSCPGAGR